MAVTAVQHLLGCCKNKFVILLSCHYINIVIKNDKNSTNRIIIFCLARGGLVISTENCSAAVFHSHKYAIYIGFNACNGLFFSSKNIPISEFTSSQTGYE